ncbi:(-)-alpha-amorphene synthase [Streptomyces cellulosae]|uniref:(-)-alpha-amorphene synthase n=1 Tax=Streptomyces cellulosae TaxID=1968 RepID=UPI000A4CC583|nr:(-)-alpha-amorphene synthase [Streptomyces cellulosae]
MPTTHEESTHIPHGSPPAATLKELIDAHLHMPFALRRNPHESSAVAAVDEWLCARGLSREPEVRSMLCSTRPAELASFTSPGVDADILQIVANQIAYQFVFDDRAEQVGRRRPERLLPMLCESVAVLRDGEPPGTVLGAALADLHRQVQERCTPAQAARWAWTSSEYVHGLLYESVAQNGSFPPRTGLCTAIRSLTAGVEPFYPLYEAARREEADPAELRHPAMRRLRRLSVDAAVWTADLFSAVKEQRAGGMINLALAHQRAQGCPLPVAVTLTIGQINTAVREFEELRARVEPELSPAGLDCVEGMAGWIGGCYHWSRTVPRYADTATVSAVP